MGRGFKVSFSTLFLTLSHSRLLFVRDMDSYYIVPEYTSHQMGAIVFKKPNSIKIPFDKAVQRLVEAGISDHIESRWTLTRRTFDPEGPESIVFEHIKVPIIFLAVSLTITIIIFVMEVLSVKKLSRPTCCWKQQQAQAQHVTKKIQVKVATRPRPVQTKK